MAGTRPTSSKPWRNSGRARGLRQSSRSEIATACSTAVPISGPSSCAGHRSTSSTASPHHVIAEVDGAANESTVESAASAVSLVSAQKASTLRQMSSTFVASTSRMIVHGNVPSLEVRFVGVRVRIEERARRSFARVIGLASGKRLEDRFERREELLTLRPSRVRDDDARRETVETGVVGDHGCDVTSLVLDLGTRPQAGTITTARRCPVQRSAAS